jgi:oligopeptide transport system permease protein
MNKPRIMFYMGGAAIVAMMGVALFPHLVTPFTEIDQNAAEILLSPSRPHWLGTDSLGRDLFARLLAASRVSLFISAAATIISLFIGISWGSLSGLYGGLVDTCMHRILDTLLAIPDLLFYILLGLFLGRDLPGIIIALSSLSWISIARITRQECLKYRNLEFVAAAQALGIGRFRIAFRHVLPQMTETLFVAVLFKIPALIALESSLSFIGLGLAPPHASFGSLAKEGFDAYLFYPHLILFPFLFIFAAVISFYTVGHAVSRKMEHGTE